MVLIATLSKRKGVATKLPENTSDNVIGPVVDEAKLTAVALAQDSMQWAEVAPDFGEIWDFDENDTLIGMLQARRNALVPDPVNGPDAKRETTVYDIVAVSDRERYSIWGSWSLDNKMQHVPDGAIVRVVYRGEEDFKAKNGEPRRVKRFAVHVLATNTADTTAASE